ncbi:Fic family protein [uncultured Holdemanella sp.]|uniref:Fic family protein n=1 Tax=uncultured Holdemanella sp. TaxID=1763549 RepID=UPI0025F27516|nr:Fic family protein [uncultured Holdemanella sp.]
MTPFSAELYPVNYKMDKDLLRLLSQANAKYTEYKIKLQTLDFDSKYFLDSILLSESLKSTQIEGTQISQDEMYYLKYMEETDNNKVIQNLKKTVEYAYEKINTGKDIDFELVNTMHRLLFDSKKKSGHIRTTQNWIGPKGAGIDNAIFIPPAPENVYGLLENLYEYMNDEFIDPYLINVALSHAQFETIHAYSDGNGRLGRALIPIQMARFEQDKPILYMSEILELYKPAYQYNLMESRKGNYLGYIKFFLQCVVDQCNSFIYKMNEIDRIYKEDMAKMETIYSATLYKIMPIILSQVVFTKKELEDMTGLSKSTIHRTIQKMEELNVISYDGSVRKKSYCYKSVYNVFVGKRNY